MDINIMEKNVATERVFDGIILHIDHLTNELPNGQLAKREVARHIGAAAVVPIDAEGNVWMVRQFRAPIDRVLLEIPAGKLDAKNEDHLEAAKRELKEECGLTAENWEFLTDFVPTCGYSDEVISIYLARGLSVGETHPDDDEFLNIVRMPLEEAVAMCVRGEINDGKTLAALLLTQKKLEA